MIDFSKYSRIERFRNSRAAKFFAENFGGDYLGWIEQKTTYKVRGIGASDKGCYVVVWE
tara:strand:+ start:830 stop:1006 length:177 start_codon:yes stop_codon:yes gene_type:complete